MPRKGRGGKREGTPGKAYSNRSDLTQAPSAAPGQEYGKAAAQLRAQQVAPLPKQPVPASGSAAPPAVPPSAGGAPPLPPGGLGALDAPTARPGEPITSGMPTGPGPGPEALTPAGIGPVDQVRAMYQANPTDDMRRLLEYIEGYG